MTKKTAIVLLLALFSLPLYSQSPGYTIKAHIKGAPDGTRYFLRKNNENGGTDTVSRGKVMNEKLEIAGYAKETELHFLFIDGQKEYFPLMLENGNFSIKGNYSDWPKMNVSGPPQNAEFQDMKKVLNVDRDRMKQLGQQIDVLISAADQDTAAMNGLVRKKDSIVSQYYKSTTFSVIKKHPHSVYTPLLIASQLDRTNEEKLKLYRELGPVAQKSIYGRELVKKITLENSAEKARSLNKAPDFTLPQITTEKETSLYNFAAKNTLTLVDFWASWCKPCRAQFDHLKQLENKYGEQGFKILGVSLDTDVKNTKKAIAADQITWMNLSAPQAFKSDVAILYNLQYIPASILIDESGNIISKNANGENLEKIINEFFTKKRKND